jgi:glycosyltransferase involved in cell wall biosynthesis
MKKNMNILLVRSDYIKKDNYTADYLQLSDSLKKLGHKVTLIGINYKNKNTFEKDLILLKMPFNRRTFLIMELTFLLPVYCIIKKIDIVMVSNRIIPATLFLILLKKLFSIKLIFDVRSIPVEDKIPWDYKRACKDAQRWYDGATFITNGTKDFIEQSFKLKYPKYAIFTSAVNPVLFSPAVTNNVPDTIKLLTKDKIVIFYHGSISPNRGINLILDAVNQLKNDFPNILFMSVSEANYIITDYCNSKNYNLNEYLLLIDPVRYDQIAAYINLGDICIVPLLRIHWWEVSSPLKLMEYLAMEKPIVLSDIAAHKSVVPPNSEFALYFNPDDPNDLGKKIREAILNIDHLKNYGYMGREIILTNYTWEIQAKILERFIYTL